jgi:small-conductance mechanosensitive channel
MPVPALVLASVSAAEADACGVDHAGAACLFVYRRFHNDVLARAADWLIARPLKIVVILLLALLAVRLLRRAVDQFVAGLARASTASGRMRASQRAQTIGLVLRSIAKVVVISLAVLMILDELGLDLAPLLAGAGIVGVAVGFGSQTLVRDFLSGMFMLIEDQFGVGDLINTGEATGVVESITLRTTRLRDEAGVVWHIPNGEIKRIANRSQASSSGQ